MEVGKNDRARKEDKTENKRKTFYGSDGNETIQNGSKYMTLTVRIKYLFYYICKFYIRLISFES